MLKKILINGLKIGISASILAYLFYRAGKDDSFDQLRDQPKQWPLLGGALLAALSAVVITIFRWYLLVRALGLSFKLRDAFRLGFLAYLFNFFTLGVVGGDAIKAVFIARQLHGRRTEAVATVIVDRMFGLFALLAVASVAFLCADFSASDVRSAADLKTLFLVCRIGVGITVAGSIALLLFLLPGFTTQSIWDFLTSLPKVGPTIERLIQMLRIYRRRMKVLAVALIMSFVVHALSVLSIFLIAHGLPGDAPSLSTHFVIVPIAMLANAIPLPGGLGALELALDFLYRSVTSAAVPAGQGFVIALGFRFCMILIATIGMGYYLVGRRQVSALMKEAKREENMSEDTKEGVTGNGTSSGSS